MAAISRRREGADYTWPGYVDALTTLLMVLIFLLSIFSVAQFTLSTVLSSRETAIDTLNSQIGDLASQLSLEKRSAEDLQKDVARLTLLSRKLQTERERLPRRRASTQRPGRARPAGAMLKDATQQIEAKTSRDHRHAEGDRAPAARAHPAGGGARGGQQREGQAVLRPHRGAEADRRAEGRGGADDRRARRALKDELARLNAALEAADAKAKEQQAQIIDLGQKLNRALASKVEELARYRSEFFGKLREALAGQRDVQIVGDRFVFQSEVLFPSGSAQLQQGGEKQLAAVARSG